MSTDPKDWGEGQEVQSNWFKFEKVGDGIKGTLVGKRYQEASTPGFPNQYIYEIETDAGVYNVGVSEKKAGTTQRLNNCQVGEIISILFEKEIPATGKGFKPAKALKVMTYGMDKDYLENQGDAEKPDVPFV